MENNIILIIRKKILLGFGTVLVVLLVVGGIVLQDLLSEIQVNFQGFMAVEHLVEEPDLTFCFIQGQDFLL